MVFWQLPELLRQLERVAPDQQSGGQPLVEHGVNLLPRIAEAEPERPEAGFDPVERGLADAAGLRGQVVAEDTPLGVPEPIGIRALIGRVNGCSA